MSYATETFFFLECLKNERKGKIKKEIASKYYRVFIKMLEKITAKKPVKSQNTWKKYLRKMCESVEQPDEWMIFWFFFVPSPSQM